MVVKVEGSIQCFILTDDVFLFFFGIEVISNIIFVIQPVLDLLDSISIKGFFANNRDCIGSVVIIGPEACAVGAVDQFTDWIKALLPTKGNIALLRLIGLTFGSGIDSGIFLDHLCQSFLIQITLPFVLCFLHFVNGRKTGFVFTLFINPFYTYIKCTSGCQPTG